MNGAAAQRREEMLNGLLLHSPPTAPTKQSQIHSTPWICLFCGLLVGSLRHSLLAAGRIGFISLSLRFSSIQPIAFHAAAGLHSLHWKEMNFILFFNGLAAAGHKSFGKSNQKFHSLAFLSLLLYSPQLLYPCTVIIYFYSLSFHKWNGANKNKL